MIQPFHLAIAVDDLEAARAFYGGLLECPEGRASGPWVDFDLYGHQLVAHLAEDRARTADHHNPVDDHAVPVPHFGVVLEWEAFEKLATRLRAHDVEFVIEPYVRFEGQVGEQATMFFRDPAGNALEFKAFRNPDQLFKR
jgi:uncharacterized protein